MHPIRPNALLCLRLMPWLCLLALLPSPALPAENMTQLSFRGDGEAHQLVVNGTYGYLASGSCVKILDLSDSQSPSEAGLFQVPTNSALAAMIVGGYLCLGGAQGLDLYALTNPLSPALASSYHDGKVTRLVKTGPDRVYAGGCGFWIYETFGPGTLALEGTWTDSSLVSVTDIEIVGNYVYLGILEQVVDYDYVYNKPKLVVLDISNPQVPTEVVRWEAEGGAPGGVIAVSGNYVYFSQGQVVRELLVNLGSPSFIYLFNSFATDGWINDVIVDGPRRILDTTSGLRIYVNETLYGSLDMYGPGGWLTRSGNLLYRPELERGLDVIDIQDLAHPSLVSHINRPSRGGTITLDGTLAYISAESFFVMDLTDPATPKVVKEIPIWAGQSIVDGNRLYVATVPDRRYPNPKGPESHRVVIFDRSNPRDPQELGHADSPTFIDDICEIDGLVFAAAYRRLEVYDCRDPLAASLITSLPLGHQTEWITKKGYYVYLGGYQGDDQTSIEAVIVKSPFRPRMVGTIYMTGYGGEPDVYENLLYVADRLTGLRTFDLSTPKKPALLHTRPNPSGAVERWGTWVAQALYPGGVSILDGTDPANPIEIAAHEAPADNYANNIAIQGSLVVVGYTHGLATYRIENAPAAPKPDAAPVDMTLKISPNPLRHGNAALAVTLANSRSASVKVYDLAGRVVRRWELDGTPSGTEEIRWDGTSEEGRPLAQGIYFVRLIAGEDRITQRMLILR